MFHQSIIRQMCLQKLFHPIYIIIAFLEWVSGRGIWEYNKGGFLVSMLRKYKQRVSHNHYSNGIYKRFFLLFLVYGYVYNLEDCFKKKPRECCVDQ